MLFDDILDAVDAEAELHDQRPLSDVLLLKVGPIHDTFPIWTESSTGSGSPWPTC